MQLYASNIVPAVQSMNETVSVYVSQSVNQSISPLVRSVSN